MKKTGYLSLILILSMGLYSAAGAEEISLNRFLKIYLENSSTLKQEWQTLEKIRAGVDKAGAIDDLRLKLTGGYTRKNDAQMGLSTYQTSDILLAEGKIDKVFSVSGTRVSLSHSVNRVSSKDGSLFIPPATLLTPPNYTGYNPGLTLAVMQPLLKNFLGLQDRFPALYAKTAEKIQEIQFTEALEKEMIEGIAAYLDWIYLIQQRKILKSIIDSNLVVLKDTEARVKAGVAENSDLEVAKETVIMFENSLREVENAYFGLMLKIQKTVPVKEDDLPEETLLSQVRTLEEKSMENIRSLQTLSLMEKQMKLLLGIKEDSLMPDLNLILSYKMLGNKESLGSAYGDLKTSELFFGFEFSMPLFNSQARGEVKESRADYLKFMEQYENSKKEILNSEKTLKNSFHTYQNLIQSQRKYIESIERKMKDEDKQYRQGMLSLRELSRTTTDLANARLTLTRYITSYHLYYYQRLGLLDGITEQYAAAIPEWLQNDKKEPETR